MPYEPSLRTLLYGRKWEEARKKIESNPKEAEVEDPMGDLPLHEVCHTGCPFQLMQKLIHTNKAALRKKGFCGRLPLHYAAYSKPSVNTIKLLLRHYPEGATILDDDGRLPLHLAVVRNAPKQTIQALIDANPKALTASNKYGNTPVMLARNEHVADLLMYEQNKPRGVHKKMQVERKLYGVWNCTKNNPVNNDKKKVPKASHSPSKRSKASSLPSSSPSSSPTSNISKPKTKILHASTNVHYTTSTSSSPTRGRKKTKSPPADKYKSRRETISSPRSPADEIMTIGLRKAIPSPEKGSGNYGGGAIMSNHRRTTLPSPSRIESRIVVA